MTEAVWPAPGPTGLHARTAGLVMKIVMGYKSRVDISANGRTADGRSLLGLMGLGERLFAFVPKDRTRSRSSRRSAHF